MKKQTSRTTTNSKAEQLAAQRQVHHEAPWCRDCGGVNIKTTYTSATNGERIDERTTLGSAIYEMVQFLRETQDVLLESNAPSTRLRAHVLVELTEMWLARVEH